MPITSEEQRKASFKHVYGKNQTNPANGLDGESLEAGHQIYSDDLLSAAGTIAFSTSAPDTMASGSTWVITSGNSMANVWASGSFVKAAKSGTDPNFEEVFFPLVEINDGHEVHVAFISASQASSGKQTPGELVQYSEGRLKNWLTPTKYGPGYAVEIYPSVANQTSPDVTNPINDYGSSEFAPDTKKYGAWAFDYYQGLLYFANPETGTLNLSGYQKPFWLKGYRYVGPTGIPEAQGTDNLGNHTASLALNMASNDIVSVANISSSGNVSASYFYGDGTHISNVGGADNLGNHTASLALNMDSNAITNVTNISASSYISASSFIGDGSKLSGIAAVGDYIVSNQTASVTNLTATGNAMLGDSDTDNHSIVGNLQTGPAIIGISGSEKQAYNDTKLDDFFKGPGESHYSLYVRNGATVVGGDIIPDRPKYHSLGSKRFPFKDLHVARGSVIFYSASADTSGSDAIEHARMSVNTSSGDVEFTSGSELKKLHVKEIGIGGVLGGAVGSVQIGTQTQGFISVNATEQGNRSTILRAESTVLSGDGIMGSITQKGSGSFAILLDADNAKPGAKFVIESNTALPGYGARLFSVSESMETRIYGNLKVDTHITASGNISASGDLMFNKIDGGTF